jgi:hypothetical protein
MIYDIFTFVNIKITAYYSRSTPSTLKMETVGSFETLEPIYNTIWRHIPEVRSLNFHTDLYFYIVLKGITYCDQYDLKQSPREMVTY